MKQPSEFNSNFGRFCLTRFPPPAQPCAQMAAPNPWMILPFALLLGAMALAPLRAPQWWLRHYAKVALGLGAVTLGYYLFVLRDAPRVLHTGARIRQLHRAHRLALRRLRRHPHRRQRRGHAAGQRHFLVRRRGRRQCSGHDRRGDAADPSVDPDEPIPRHGASHRLFHFHRRQRRRLPHAHRRPAAVSWLFAGRAVLVGREKLLADVGDGRRHPAGDFLCRGPHQFPPRAARRARTGNRA